MIDMVLVEVNDFNYKEMIIVIVVMIMVIMVIMIFFILIPGCIFSYHDGTSLHNPFFGCFSNGYIKFINRATETISQFFTSQNPVNSS